MLKQVEPASRSLEACDGNRFRCNVAQISRKDLDINLKSDSEWSEHLFDNCSCTPNQGVMQVSEITKNIWSVHPSSIQNEENPKILGDQRKKNEIVTWDSSENEEGLSMKDESNGNTPIMLNDRRKAIKYIFSSKQNQAPTSSLEKNMVMTRTGRDSVHNARKKKYLSDRDSDNKSCAEILDTIKKLETPRK
ncbi:hypothetical protein LIER_26779 [Lithospermum erythrorhizon]|uniref:Uncharacterized protein n=1 Tax=Lithospermum erythrorhizon TaxID=34254 RepID=A0AAV3R9L3_LITER